MVTSGGALDAVDQALNLDIDHRVGGCDRVYEDLLPWFARKRRAQVSHQLLHVEDASRRSRFEVEASVSQYQRWLTGLHTDGLRPRPQGQLRQRPGQVSRQLRPRALRTRRPAN